MEKKPEAAWKPSDMEIVEALQTLPEKTRETFIKQLEILVKQSDTKEIA